MVNVIHSEKDLKTAGEMGLVKKTNVIKTVDDETVVIGKGTEKVSQRETQSMLAEQLDRLPKDSPERAVYEKVYKGVKQFD
jgi:hypothetical protein